MMDRANNHRLVIDGSYKEGGGQIIRNAITYATLLKKPVTIVNIRANRPKNQGVRPQHLTGMKLAVDIHGGDLIGAEVGSTTVSYEPPDTGRSLVSKRRMENHQGVKYVADTGTAGSVALLLQTSFLPALASSMYLDKTIELELRGGTNAENAPQIDYVMNILLPFINGYYKSKCNNHRDNTLDIEIVKRGYYPKGGGIIRALISPPKCSTKSSNTVTFPPIKLTECKPISSLRIKAFHAGNCPSWIPQKMVDGALKALKRACKENRLFSERFCGNNSDAKTNALVIIESAEIIISHEQNCIGSGSGIMLVAYPCSTNDSTECEVQHLPLGASGLGDRKTAPIQSGIKAATELIHSIASGGCVDRWMQDQLIPFMALANCNRECGVQKSELTIGELTLHTQTAMAVAEWITNCKFEVEKLPDNASCDCADETIIQKTEQKDYGETGLIHGRHIIRCEGIGFEFKLGNDVASG
jgi:RNA 3'-terminal phosphate cyclase (ATP)